MPKSSRCLVHFQRAIACAMAILLASSLSARADADGQYKTEIVPQLGHSGAVTSVAFSPDGRHVVSGGADSTIKLWDLATGKLIRTLSDQHVDPTFHSARGVTSVAFSPDGRHVLSGNLHGALRLWDATTGDLLHSIDSSSPGGIWSVAFSPNGQQLFSRAGDDIIRIWNALTSQLVRSFEMRRDNDDVFSFALSDDGRQALSGSNHDVVRLWDVETGSLLRTLSDLSNVILGDEVWSVAFSPSSRQVVSGKKYGLINLWDATTGELLRTFKGHTGKVASVGFSPDGRHVLSGSEDNTIKLWDATTGALLRTFEGHSAGVTSVGFSPDGQQLLSASRDATIGLWNAVTGERVRTLEGYSNEVTSVAFSPDGGHVLSGSGDSTVKLWDATRGALVRVHSGHSADVTSVAYSPDGRHVLSGSEDNTIKLWDATTGALLRTFEGHSSGVRSAAFSADGHQVLSGSSDGSIRLWDASTAELVRSVEEHFDEVASVSFSPSGRQVLAGGGTTLRGWDAATGAVNFTPEHDHHLVNSVAFSPDGSLIAVATEHSVIELWNAKTGVMEDFSDTTGTNGHWASVASVAFSPDGRQLVSGSLDATVRLWDATFPMALLRGWEGHSAGVTSVAFSPDGHQVLSGSKDSTTRLWDAETGKLLVTSIGARDGEWLALIPDGFFGASSPKAALLLGLVRGLDVYGFDQMWQSLYSPDLVREQLAGDRDREVAQARAITNLDRILDSGKAPSVVISAPASPAQSDDEIITAEATITAKENGGIGRVEWRVNGITVGVSNPPPGNAETVTVTKTLALDRGENTIEVAVYNGRNLLMSVPAQTKITWIGTTSTEKPKLHVLAIGINKYIDKGGIASGETGIKRFPPLGLAVSDATALAAELKKAGEGLYVGVHVRTVLDEEATAANLDSIVTQMAAAIEPRDTFVFYAATHGYSLKGRFYLIPQDYQGGPVSQALAEHAIDQLKLQDWIANRIKAKKALILLDSCESGALTAGYARSRFDGSASDAAIGRLHEATGRPVLTAAGLGQSALELTELGHGVFTSALIDSFYRGDTNSDGVVSVAELVAHVQNLTPRLIKEPKIRVEFIRRGPTGGVQSARFGGRGEDFAFVRRLQ